MGNTGEDHQRLATMVDVDLDSDMDFLMGADATVFWEFKGKDASPKWEMHIVGGDGNCETSAKAFDITNDNHPDQMAGSNWFQNPGAAGDMDVIEQAHWGSSDNIWLENTDGTGKNRTKHVVGECETRGHSANIADIDNDGDTDFKLGEDGGPAMDSISRRRGPMSSHNP